MSQLQRDLEALLGEVDAGWDNRNGRRATCAVWTGIGGCLVNEMYRITGYGLKATERVMEMICALGFVFPTGNASPGAMYDWNDAQTDPDQIKLRIKDALNNL